MKKILCLILLGLILLLCGTYVFVKKDVTDKRKIDVVIDVKRSIPLKKSLEVFDFSDDIVFRAYLKFYRDGGKKIKAGYYEIKGDYSIEEIIDVLEKGNEKSYTITIIEGVRVKDVIEKLVREERINEEKFYEELNKIDFPYPTPDKNFEGYFYPETYSIPQNAQEKDIIEIFLGEFLKRFPPEKYEDKDEFYQKLILASIIEREAAWDKEKPIMASVFYNRIKKGMTLSADSTINYVFEYKKKRILYKDLKVESPYNTYVNKGLPPGPIANPTVSSVDATYNPAKTDYLFFVTKGGGEHFFSKTYKEHLDFQKELAKLKKEKEEKEEKERKKLEQEKLKQEKLKQESGQEGLLTDTAEDNFLEEVKKEIKEEVEKELKEEVEKELKEELKEEIKEELEEEMINGLQPEGTE